MGARAMNDEVCPKVAARARAQKNYGPLLERNGFTNVAFTSDYAFDCDQVGTKCPLCENVHQRNKYYVCRRGNGDVCVKKLLEEVYRARRRHGKPPAVRFQAVIHTRSYSEPV